MEKIFSFRRCRNAIHQILNSVKLEKLKPKRKECALSYKYKLKLIFLIFFGLNTLNFSYISEELTDKYHLRKSILACMGILTIFSKDPKSSEEIYKKI
jgi:hypothetical protein